MLELEKAVHESGLELALLELVRIRASQINGCAFCLDMPTKDARARGESEQRIYVLDAWRDTPLFTSRERAALAWTEAVTLVAETRVPDAAYDEVRREFEERGIVALTYAVVAINGLTRFALRDGWHGLHPSRRARSVVSPSRDGRGARCRQETIPSGFVVPQLPRVKSGNCCGAPASLTDFSLSGATDDQKQPS